MNAYTLVPIIIALAAIFMMGALYLASFAWPALTGNVRVAIFLPLVGGLAILSPLLIRRWTKR